MIVLVYSLKNKELSFKILHFILPAYALISVILFKSRGAGVDVEEKDNHVKIYFE